MERLAPEKSAVASMGSFWQMRRGVARSAHDFHTGKGRATGLKLTDAM